jgi:hypothetical protein
MRNKSVLGALIAALALTAAPAAQAANRADGCHPKHARTAARNANVRVFWVGHRLYACATGQRRAYELVELPNPCPGSTSTGCDDVSAIRVAGRYVAVVQISGGSDHGEVSVEVVDVARRRSVADWTTPYGFYRYDDITDLELSPRGALGLIVRTVYAEPGPTVTYEVRALTSQRNAVIDSGPDIAPRSLALASDGTLYWTNAGAPRSAALR